MLESPCGKEPAVLRVAVVGSGPSGVYTAQSLVEQQAVPDVRVHVLDRLPCPYGLVRYGVAPDHEKIKSLQNNLRTVLDHPDVSFLGNVHIGEGGLGAEELHELYHAVVYCVGAATDRHLGVPGETLWGSFSATDFVAWYSAHPDAATHRFPLDGPAAVVIGVGNVAVDVTRILARSVDELAPTDMPQGPLGALAGSAIEDVYMVGRRGPSQAKFTTKELRELGALTGAEVVVRPEELALDPAFADPSGLPAVNRRNVEVLRSWAAEPPRGAGRRIHLRFFLRPVAVLAGPDGERVAGVRFERTLPDGHGGVAGTGNYEEIAAGTVLRSVGYRGVPLPGLPFDAESGTVPHEEGRVVRDGAPSPGEYVAGWIKRGPTGVIGTNRPCAKQTAASVLADAGSLAARRVPGDPVEELRRLGQAPVEWPGWQGIEAAEAALGRSLGRPMVKIPDWAGLLAAASAGTSNGASTAVHAKSAVRSGTGTNVPGTGTSISGTGQEAAGAGG
ncbi:FAD-dependent oxidoreductase [Streptomyces sp. NPDC051776]|uniref:FAD-dependent oxidoreductase n=1 Tax=Streptomyces sp. NPDC051776 TaxID=3155414 RepID=UPI0034209D1F